MFSVHENILSLSLKGKMESVLPKYCTFEPFCILWYVALSRAVHVAWYLLANRVTKLNEPRDLKGKRESVLPSAALLSHFIYSVV